MTKAKTKVIKSSLNDNPLKINSEIKVDLEIKLGVPEVVNTHIVDLEDRLHALQDSISQKMKTDEAALAVQEKLLAVSAKKMVREYKADSLATELAASASRHFDNKTFRVFVTESECCVDKRLIVVDVQVAQVLPTDKVRKDDEDEEAPTSDYRSTRILVGPSKEVTLKFSTVMDEQLNNVLTAKKQMEDTRGHRDSVCRALSNLPRYRRATEGHLTRKMLQGELKTTADIITALDSVKLAGLPSTKVNNLYLTDETEK